MKAKRITATTMGTYGKIAWSAYHLATEKSMSPQDAWRASLEEHYTHKQLCNAIKHTCPRGAFLGLCQDGLLPGIIAGHYTRSVSSRRHALAAVELLRANPSLANDRGRLEAQVFGERTPNDEVVVVLALWGQGLLR